MTARQAQVRALVRNPWTWARVIGCVGFLLAALGDTTSGPYDGPGPFFDLGMAVVFAVAPWWIGTWLAILYSAVDLVGAFRNPQAPAILADPGHLGPFVAVVVQLAGFVIGAAGAVALARMRLAARRAP
jgi:hypothetical protein